MLREALLTLRSVGVLVALIAVIVVVPTWLGPATRSAPPYVPTAPCDTTGLDGVDALAVTVFHQDFGVCVHCARIKRLNYVDSVRQQVYLRMISERQRIAQRFRSEGEGLKLCFDRADGVVN